MKRDFSVLCLASFLVWVRVEASDADGLIHWLLEDNRELKDIPFSEVVKAATDKQILPINATNDVDRLLLQKINSALDRVLARMNMPNSIVQQQRRINEVSSYFESAIKQELNAVPGFVCDFPNTSAGHVERSGYPDLRLEDKTTGRVLYVDPKLYERGSGESSFRTFYFEPKKETNKIHDDAHHLIVGVEHDGRQKGVWKFLRWELVDLSRFHVRLKAEFQASNRDLYRPEATVARGAATEKPVAK